MPSYSPLWAPHVTSDFPHKTVDEDGRVEPMKVNMRCSLCGESFQYTCDSGAPQQHVQKFGLLHLHRDPFKAGPQTGT